MPLSRFDMVQNNVDLDSTTSLSSAAEWHRMRRKAMIQKYGDQILPLERSASSQNIAVPLLLVTNLSLLGLAIWSGSLSVGSVMLLSLFPGSMFSLWQLQILHDCLHGECAGLLFQEKNFYRFCHLIFTIDRVSI